MIGHFRYVDFIGVISQRQASIGVDSWQRHMSQSEFIEENTKENGKPQVSLRLVEALRKLGRFIP